MTEQLPSRREVLGLIATGTAAISGCSESERADTPERSDGSGTTGPSAQGTESPTERTESSPEGTEPVAEGESQGETSLDGEEQFEEYLDSSVDIGDPFVDKPAYHWIEFENPSGQISSPVPEEMPNYELLNYNIEEELRGQNQGEFNSLYLVIEQNPDGQGVEVTHYFFVEDEWDDQLSAQENMEQAEGRLGGRNAESIEMSVVESLLTENVQEYDEVSDDLPPEYQDWIEG